MSDAQLPLCERGAVLPLPLLPPVALVLPLALPLPVELRTRLVL